MSLRVRLSLAAAIAVLVATTLSSVVVYLVVSRQSSHKVDRSLSNHAAAIESRGFAKLRALEFRQPTFGGVAGIAQLITAGGTVLRQAGTPPALAPGASAEAVAAGERGPFLTTAATPLGSFRVLTVPLGSGYALQIARPIGDVSSALHDLGTVLLLVNLGAIAAAAALGLAVAKTALRPLDDLTQTVEKMAVSGKLDTTVPTGSGEIGILASRFTELIEMLRTAREAQQRLVADASHELRTPLTSIRMNLETLLEDVALPAADRERLLNDLIAQTDELTMLVGDLIEVARESEPDHSLTDVRFDRLVDEAVTRARSHPRPVLIRATLEPCTVSGVPNRLERAVGNLLDNAIKWSPPGGPIDVTLLDGELSVTDHGPGIAAEDLPHVFERFYRASEARGTPGSGLGLAIVRSVAETHGGAVTVESDARTGTVLRFRLPCTHVPAGR